MSANKLVSAPAETHSPRKKELTGSNTAGLLGRQPIIGLILFLFGGLLFAGFTINLVDHGPLLAWDQAVANTLPAMGLQGPPFLHPLMDAGFYIGDQLIAVLSVLIGLFLIIKRHWKDLAMLAIGMIGASSLFLSLSNLIGRPRPPTQIWIVLSIPGFPSGHAISTVVFYGLMAYFIVPKIRSAVWKGVVIFAALFIIAFVGFSRIFTGGHYLTDVLAGYSLGIAWSGLIFTLIEIISQKIRNRNVENDLPEKSGLGLG